MPNVKLLDQAESTNRGSARRGTHLYTRFCPAAWFPFCMVRYREKQQKMLELLIYFTE